MDTGIGLGLVFFIGGILIFLKAYFGAKKGQFSDRYGTISRERNPLRFKIEYYSYVVLSIIFFISTILSLLFL